MPVLGRVQYHQPGSTRAQILIDHQGIPGNRIDPEYRWVTVELSDARDPQHRPSFADDGLCFVVAPTRLHAPEHLEAHRVAYEAELTDLLTRELGAEDVVIFDHTLRHEGEGFRPPSYHVHCDYNARSAHLRMVALLGAAQAERWERGRFAIVNVWRPLVCAARRSPLGFVRPTSVRSEDWVEVDIVFPDRTGQIRGLAHHPDHRWIYRPDMRPDEAALFTVFANDDAGVTGVAHAAIDLLSVPADAPPRQSIESRAFVRFG